MNEQYRQGDILIEQVSEIPSRTTRRPDLVLAQGEATGHCHTAEGDVELYEREEVLYLRVGPQGATVTHQEHAQIPLAPGCYSVTRQREYTPEAIRYVQD